MPNQTTAPTISIIIPVRNDASRLERCLRSIRACDAAPGLLELVVGDNGSTDDSPGVANRAGATVLSLPDRSVAEVRNEAARHCRGEVIAFVDADHEVERGWLRAAAAALTDPSVGMAGAPYDAPPEATWVQRAFDAMRTTVRDGDALLWLPSGNMVLRRSAFEAVNGFDAALESCEDFDLCRRIRARGFTIRATPRMRSFHLGDPATLYTLFKSERWRGRNNLLASFRRPVDLRGLISAFLPVADLLLLTVTVTALLAIRAGLPVAAATLGTIGALAAARAVRMLRSGRHLQASAPVAVLQAWVVALVYNGARAAALVTWAGHHRRPSVRPSTTAHIPPADEQTHTRTGVAER